MRSEAATQSSRDAENGTQDFRLARLAFNQLNDIPKPEIILWTLESPFSSLNIMKRWNGIECKLSYVTNCLISLTSLHLHLKKISALYGCRWQPWCTQILLPYNFTLSVFSPAPLVSSMLLHNWQSLRSLFSLFKHSSLRSSNVWFLSCILILGPMSHKWLYTIILLTLLHALLYLPQFMFFKNRK